MSAPKNIAVGDLLMINKSILIENMCVVIDVSRSTAKLAFPFDDNTVIEDSFIIIEQNDEKI